MKKVYICAPLGGDIQGNLEKAKRYTEYALKCGTAPVVPHFYALCLNDDIPSEREIGLSAGMSRCGSAMSCGSSATKSPKGCGVKSISAKISISKPAL